MVKTLLLSLIGCLSANDIYVGTVCPTTCTYSNANLQTAINAAKIGDNVILSAGESFTGNWVIPAKHSTRNNGSDWLTITSSRVKELPPVGTRVGPEHADLMPNLINNSSDPTIGWALEVGWITGYANVASGELTVNETFLTGASAISNGDRVTLRDQDNNNAITPMLVNTPYYVVQKSGGVFKLSETYGGAAIAPITYVPPTRSTPVSCTTTGCWGRVLVHKVDPPRHYRLQGLHMSTNGGGGQIANMVLFGNSQESSYDSLPQAMEVDRCYIHGIALDASEGPKNGIYINGSANIHDSSILDIKSSGDESHGVAGFIVPGPVRVANNKIEVASINTILGGGSAQIVGMINGERVGAFFSHNFMTKKGQWKWRSSASGSTGVPPTTLCIEDEFVKFSNINEGWRCTAAKAWERRDDLLATRTQKWPVKNIFEFKAVTQMYSEGNKFTKSWVDGQAGEGFLFQSIDRRDWWSEWTELSKMHIKNSIFSEVAAVGAIFRLKHTSGNPNRNIYLDNNLGYDIGGYDGRFAQNATGDIIRIEWNQRDILAKHNTFAMKDGYRGLMFYVDSEDVAGSPGARYLLQDGIMGNGLYSFLHTCPTEVAAAPGYSIDRVMRWNPNSESTSSPGSCATNMSSITGATALTDLFEDYANWDLRVKSSNAAAYRTASDGRDLGVSFPELNAATSNVESGDPIWADKYGFTVKLGSTKALLTYTRPTDSACDVVLYNQYARTSTHADSATPADTRTGNIVEGRRVQYVLGTVSALTASTTYWGMLTCGTVVIPFDLRTTPTGAASEISLEFSTARSGQYSASAAMSSPTSISSAASWKVPIAQGAVTYVQESTTGPIRVFLNR